MSRSLRPQYRAFLSSFLHDSYLASYLPLQYNKRASTYSTCLVAFVWLNVVLDCTVPSLFSQMWWDAVSDRVWGIVISFSKIAWRTRSAFCRTCITSDTYRNQWSSSLAWQWSNWLKCCQPNSYLSLRKRAAHSFISPAFQLLAADQFDHQQTRVSGLPRRTLLLKQGGYFFLEAISSK